MKKKKRLERLQLENKIDTVNELTIWTKISLSSYAPALGGSSFRLVSELPIHIQFV